MSLAPSERPHVTVNFALTWDSRISTRNRTPSDFSSRKDKRRLLEIRAEGDAVLAGARTIAADWMTMGLPDEALRQARVARGQTEYPTRVLLTNSGRIDPSIPVFSKDFSPILIFSTECMPGDVREALQGKAVLNLSPGERVDLSRMMTLLLKDHGIRRVVCEGGGEVFRSLLSLDLVDEIHLTLCPRIFGGSEAPTLTGLAGEFLQRSTRCDLQQMEVEDDECFLLYRVRRQNA